MTQLVTISLGKSADGVEEALAFAVTAVKDFRPLWRRLRQPWYESRREMYRTRGRSTGTPWASPLVTHERFIYIWAKASMTGLQPAEDQVLRWLGPKTGGRERLHPSLTDPRHRETLWVMRTRSLQAGTKVPHAKRINDGVGPPGPEWFPRAWRVPPIARRLVSAGQRFTADVAEGAAVWLGEIAARAEAGGERVQHGLRTADVLATTNVADVTGA